MESNSATLEPLIENYLLRSVYTMVEVEIFYLKQGSHEFWNVMEIDYASFQNLESFGKRVYLKRLWRSFGFLLRKILKYPKIDVMQCRIKYRICFVCSFYYL